MTRKLQFAEEGPMLQVESYELLKTLRWCECLINSILFLNVLQIFFSKYSILCILFQQYLGLLKDSHADENGTRRNWPYICY